MIIIIRQANSNDIQALTHIWKDCFHDNNDYIKLFFDNCFYFDRCFIYEADGIPVSMLHLLPQKIINHDREYKTQYLYAAATLPEYQKKGIMGKLIQAAELDGTKNNCDFTIIMPASQSLYNYYEKFGYKTAFSIKRAVVSRAKLIEMSKGIKPLAVIDYNSGKIEDLRKKVFKNAVFWNGDMTEYIADEWKYCGGDILLFKNGFVFCIKKSNGLYIKEFCADSEAYINIISNLLLNYNCSTFYFYLYPEMQLFDNCEIINTGMIKRMPLIYNGDTQKSLTGMTYINMMLD